MSGHDRVEAEPPWVVNAPPRGRWPALDVRQFWSHGELIYFFAVRDVKVRYKQAVLGVAWAGIQPLVGAITFTVLFNRLADVDVDGHSYFAFALVGFALWTYFSASVQAGTTSLLYNSELLTKVAFPRIVPPTAALLPPVIDLGVAMAFATVVAIVSEGGPGPLDVVLGLPSGAVLLILSVIGPVLFLSAAVVKYRDMQTLVAFALQFLLFASPVAYPAEIVPDGWRTLLYVNPFAGALGLVRSAIVGTDAPTTGQLLLSSVVAVVVAIGGLVHFRRNEREFADVI